MILSHRNHRRLEGSYVGRLRRRIAQEPRRYVAPEAARARQHAVRLVDQRREERPVRHHPPDDVLAARRGGLGAIAVASGGHDRGDLLACGPDAVLDRLDELIDLVAAD